MNGMVISGILIYIVAMLLIGYWSSKRIKNLADFLVAGRRLPFYLALATLFATWFGAGSCMGASGTAYEEGILGVIADPFAAGVALILAGLFYVALLRRLELLTVTDIFGRYYSKNSEICASLLMVPVYIGWLGCQIVALGYIANILTGIDKIAGIVIGAGIVLLYTFAGGMWAVTLTDFIQVIILVAGLLTIFPIVLNNIGGFEVLVNETPREFWHFFPKGGGYQGWMAYAGQWMLMGLGCIVGQDLIQRSLASKTESIAKHSAVWAGVAYIVIGFIPIFLGFAGRIIMPGLADPELVIPNLAMQFLPPFLLILFIGALFAAIMSSADSSLLAATSLTTNNIILRLFPNTKEKNILPLARVVTVVVTVISMLVALKAQQIYDLMVNSWATLFVGILVPVTAALYWKKANTAAAWASMLLGTATWLGYIIIKTGALQESPVFYVAAVYGGIVSLVSYVVVALIKPSRFLRAGSH
jgi:SSS family transporter